MTSPNLASMAAIQQIKKKNHDPHSIVAAKRVTIIISKLIKIHKIFLLLIMMFTKKIITK